MAGDGVILLEDIKTFREALGTTFALYFMLNAEYPAEISTTLEFMQRLV